MILLVQTTESLSITTTTAADIDYSVSFADIGASTFAPGTSEGTITSGTSTLLGAPTGTNKRQVKLITIANRHGTLANTVVVKKLISADDYSLTPTVNLLSGETLEYMDGKGWTYYSANGTIKHQQNASGTDDTVQFSNNGVLTGDAGLKFDANNEMLSVDNPNATLRLGGSDTDPTNPPKNTLALFARNIANRMLLAQVGPSGLTTSLQPILARNKVGYWCPPGNATTVPLVFGLTALTGNGATATRTVTTASLATRMRRLGYASTTTAGTFAGARLPVAQFSCGSGSNDGSGFMLVERWVEADAAVVAGKRAFHGMTATTAAFTNVEVDTLLNQVGICKLSTDATQWYWIASGSSAQAAVAIGANIGAPGGNSTTAWELAIFAPNGVANTFYLQLTNITTGAIATRTVTGDDTTCPQSTTLLAWNAWATNNAALLVTAIDLCSLYIETDN